MRLRHFATDEFDSPDDPGSGEWMHVAVVGALDEARQRSGLVLPINSGLRTPAHNEEVGGVEDSAHLDGLAADLARDPGWDWETVMRLLHVLWEVGFRRFGLGAHSIHVDLDHSKPWPAWWDYY